MNSHARPLPGGKVLLGLALLMAGLALVACARPKGPRLQDGAFKASAEGVHGPITVQVTVKRGRIAAVDVLSQAEAAGVADLAFQRIPAEIVKKQSTEVEAVAGASTSSKAIMAAAAEALKAAAKN